MTSYINCRRVFFKKKFLHSFSKNREKTQKVMYENVMVFFRNPEGVGRLLLASVPRFLTQVPPPSPTPPPQFLNESVWLQLSLSKFSKSDPGSKIFSLRPSGFGSKKIDQMALSSFAPDPYSLHISEMQNSFTFKNIIIVFKSLRLQVKKQSTGGGPSSSNFRLRIRVLFLFSNFLTNFFERWEKLPFFSASEKPFMRSKIEKKLLAIVQHYFLHHRTKFQLNSFSQILK